MLHYRNKKLFAALTVILIAFVLMAYTNIKLTDSKSVYSNGNNKKVILLDPGHGGFDAGASSNSGIQEKEINLKIGLKLRDKLKSQGFDVVMTREEDKALLSGKKVKSKKAEDLGNRCNMKSESKCDLFISIHQNHFPQGQYYGSQVWYGDSAESKRLARIVQENLRTDLDKNNNRLEKAAKDSYKILRSDSHITSILVECGFLSNYAEAQKLNSDDYQNKIADSLAKSIKEYFETKVDN